MKWTYDQYLDQPSWFIDSIYTKMYEDNVFNSKSK